MGAGWRVEGIYHARPCDPCQASPRLALTSLASLPGPRLARPRAASLYLTVVPGSGLAPFEGFVGWRRVECCGGCRVCPVTSLSVV